MKIVDSVVLLDMQDLKGISESAHAVPYRYSGILFGKTEVSGVRAGAEVVAAQFADVVKNLLRIGTLGRMDYSVFTSAEEVLDGALHVPFLQSRNQLSVELQVVLEVLVLSLVTDPSGHDYRMDNGMACTQDMSGQDILDGDVDELVGIGRLEGSEDGMGLAYDHIVAVGNLPDGAEFGNDLVFGQAVDTGFLQRFQCGGSSVNGVIDGIDTAGLEDAEGFLVSVLSDKGYRT